MSDFENHKIIRPHGDSSKTAAECKLRLVLVRASPTTSTSVAAAAAAEGEEEQQLRGLGEPVIGNRSRDCIPHTRQPT